MPQPDSRHAIVATSTILADGRYTLQQRLTQETQSSLYLAIDHEAFDRTVLIDMLPDYFAAPDHQATQAARGNFLHVIKQVATLKHPAVPQIFAYFQDGPHAYIVMEHIDGQNLQQYLTHTASSGTLFPSHPFPQEQVLQWGIALARLLEHLEQRPTPVVHANICPAHLILDQHSGELRLVGFGGASTGTPGYAAPEQAHGSATPSSDWYALAATLYHLVTDDDPGNHPGTFPRIDGLGSLGPVLQQALHPDPARRLPPTALRHQLELILKTGSIPRLEAPDGTLIPDLATLARWCEAHWSSATTWLYGKLPDQIEVRWQQQPLAQQLRTIVARHQNRDAGLDACLSLLDPQGYGASCYLEFDPPIIDYGSIPANFAATRILRITNQGRRFRRLQVNTPFWIRISQRIVTLHSGETCHLTLSINPSTLRPGQPLHAEIEIYDGNTHQQIKIQVHISAWRTVWHFIRRRLWLFLFVLPCLLCAGAVYLPNLVAQIEQEQRKANYYQAGIAALEQESWAKARNQLQWAGDYRDAPDLLAQSYDRELQTALATQNWNNAAVAIAQLYAERGSYAQYTDSIAQNPPLAQALTALRTEAWQSGTVLVKQTSFAFAETFTLSPDGTYVALSDAEKTLQMWPVHATAPQYEITDLPPIVNMTFSQDGTVFAVNSNAGTINLFHVGTGSRFQTFNSLGANISSIALSPNGTLLSVGYATGSVTLWDVETGTQIQTLAGHSDAIQGMTFSPDGETLAVFSQDGTVTLWRVQDGTLLQTFTGHSDWVNTVVFSPDGTQLASGGADGRVILWQLGDDAAPRLLVTSDDPVTSIVFHPNGHILVTGSLRGTIKLWRVPDGTLFQTNTNDFYPLDQMAFGDNGLILVARSDRGAIAFLRAEFQQSAHTVQSSRE